MDRTRRLRQTAVMRSMVRENHVRTEELIYPLFVMEGENTILYNLMQGKENPVICEELTISTNTLKKHILNIYRKLGIRNRVQLFKMIREHEETV